MILSDLGTSFMSCTLHKLYELLGIKLICTNVYHPQMDELDEMFNQMLKNMIHMFVYTAAQNWDK